MVALSWIILNFLILPSLSESDGSFAKWVLKEKCSKHATVQCILDARNELDKWLEENNQYTILVAGKMGSGKTTLVKGFTENYMPGGDGNNSLLPHTIKVSPYQYEYKGVKISLYDTPGLSEEEKGNVDFKYLEDMVDHEISPNLIVFTVKMDSAAGDSLPVEDEYVMKRVSDTFGWARWRFAMVVLTFANKVQKEELLFDDFENRHYFKEVWNKLELQIQRTLKNFHVQSEVVNSIPIFPIGYLQQPVLLADKRGESWVDEFWSNAFTILQKSKHEEKLCKQNVQKGECCACPVRDNQMYESTKTDTENTSQNRQIEETENNQAKDLGGKDEL